MSHRRVLGVAAGMDQTQHHFAGIDADADLDRRPAGLVCITVAECVAHRDGGVHCPLGMVLVRCRGAK